MLPVVALPYPFSPYRTRRTAFPLLLLSMLAQLAAHSVANVHFSEHFPRSRADHLLRPVPQQSAGGAQANSARGVSRCYSCMSLMYAELFKDSDLGKHFFEPRNFSAQCDDPMDPAGIGLVPCRGICLTLSQEFIIMGRKTGKRLTMRGCASSLSRHGYHNRTIAFFAEFDLCRELLASELFRLSTELTSEEIYYGGHGAGFMAMAGPMNAMDGQPVQVCSCLGDRCNWQSSSGSAVVGRRRQFYFCGFASIIVALLIFSKKFIIFVPNCV